MMNYMTKKDNLFDAFNEFFSPIFSTDVPETMKTDVVEADNGYTMNMEVPGFNKEDIKVKFENGYLTVSAHKTEKENEGKKHYMRRECTTSCSRSFYVGENLSKENLKAKYDNGILSLFIPKEEKKEISSHLIEIE